MLVGEQVIVSVLLYVLASNGPRLRCWPSPCAEPPMFGGAYSAIAFRSAVSLGFVLGRAVRTARLLFGVLTRTFLFAFLLGAHCGVAWIG